PWIPLSGCGLIFPRVAFRRAVASSARGVTIPGPRALSVSALVVGVVGELEVVAEAEPRDSTRHKHAQADGHQGTNTRQHRGWSGVGGILAWQGACRDGAGGRDRLPLRGSRAKTGRGARRRLGGALSRGGFAGSRTGTGGRSRHHQQLAALAALGAPPHA